MGHHCFYIGNLGFNKLFSDGPVFNQVVDGLKIGLHLNQPHADSHGVRISWVPVFIGEPLEHDFDEPPVPNNMIVGEGCEVRPLSECLRLIGPRVASNLHSQIDQRSYDSYATNEVSQVAKNLYHCSPVLCDQHKLRQNNPKAISAGSPNLLDQRRVSELNLAHNLACIVELKKIEQLGIIDAVCWYVLNLDAAKHCSR